MRTLFRQAPFVLFLASCTGDIGEKGDDGSSTPSISCADDEGGVIETSVNATDEELWVYFDFESCEFS